MADNEELKFPDVLKPDGAGRELWSWLQEHCDGLQDCAPLAEELCAVRDRLSEVRAKIAAQGLLTSGARGRSVRNPLLDSEAKLSRQFSFLWRQLGLADKQSEEERRPPGR